jgi:prepilin-type N-terminal cleavage/methylation domain-containing protein/prepilin-type processing-associated H-X9-DG protein
MRYHDAWRRRLRDSRAFTLIEVLVVVAIIALLIAILLPALASARAQARSSVCLSNLEQQGKAAFLYAHDKNGFFPSSQFDALERIPKTTRRFLIRMTQKSGAAIFYCPSNTVRPWTVANFALDYPSAADEGKILYWWTANPPPAHAERFHDTNSNGTNRDEYVAKVDEKFVHKIALSTDQSRQMTTGWFFFHGRGQGIAPDTYDTRGVSESWKNTLYADGHAESIRGFKVIPRWGMIDAKPKNYAGW